MTFGVTSTGFTRKLFSDIQSGIFAYWRGKISKLLQLTEKTGLGNVGNGAADQLAEAWEAIEAAYYANDPDNADDASFVAVCAITGTIQRGAQKGTVTGTCTFGTGFNYPPGALVANVAGQSSNRWTNRDAVGPTFVGANVPVVFQSEFASSAAIAPAGTLVIAQPIGGWLTINNAADAQPGQDIESIEALAIRREEELAGSGSGPLAAVRAAVSKVPGVISVKARQNVTSTPGVNGLPIKSFQIIAWDGVAPAATNDAIAQAILKAGPAGIQSVGAVTGNALDDDGLAQAIPFSRPTQQPVYVTCSVSGTASSDAVKAALLSAGAKMSTGVTYKKLEAAAIDVDGVTDVLDLRIGFAPSPSGTVNLAVDFAAIALFDASRVTVTLV